MLSRSRITAITRRLERRCALFAFRRHNQKMNVLFVIWGLLVGAMLIVQWNMR